MAIFRKLSVGLEFSGKSVRFVELIRKNRKIEVGHFGEVPLLPGTIAGGIITGADHLKNLLKKLKKEFNWKNVWVSIGEQYSLPLRLTIPKVCPKGAKETIELKIRDLVSLGDKEFEFEHKVTREADDSYDIEINAIHPLPRETHYSILKSAGFKQVDFLAESEAIKQALIDSDNKSAYLIVYFGEDKLKIITVSDGLIRDQLLISLPSKIAEQMADSKNFSSLKDKIDNQMVSWGLDHKSSQKIKQIILCGKISNLPALAEYLEFNLKIPSVLGNVWTNLFSFDDYIPPIALEESMPYVVPVGLAQISLLSNRKG
jgi:Tfp pilus assembly PilM family ATPase